MATENKEKAKGEAIFPLTQEQINQIAAIGAKEGVRAYKEEQKKEERRRKKEDSKVRKTKKLLSSYRRIKATLSDGEQFTPEEQAELRWKFVEDLMGNTREIAGKSERTINSCDIITQNQIQFIQISTHPCNWRNCIVWDAICITENINFWIRISTPLRKDMICSRYNTIHCSPL